MDSMRRQNEIEFLGQNENMNNIFYSYLFLDKSHND